MKISAALAMTVLAYSQAASAQQVRFTGETTADQTLIKDALQQLAQHAYATQGCATLTAVTSLVLPESFQPGPKYRVAATNVRYERWDATLCDRPFSYLVGFWPSPEGGTMFQVSHPFPEDAQSLSR